MEKAKPGFLVGLGGRELLSEAPSAWAKIAVFLVRMFNFPWGLQEIKE